MGGLQPGDKVTAANFNDAYLCKNDDDTSTGRIETERYFVEGKADVEAGVGQTLTAETGIILLTAPAAPTGTEGATTIAADPTQGFENGQRLTIINCSGGNYELSTLADPLTIPDGSGVTLYYCTAKNNWLPAGGTGASSSDCKNIASPAPTGSAVGDHVYFDGTNWVIGTNNTIETAGNFYITEVSPSGFKIQASGFVQSIGHGFNPGEYYFVDANGGYTNVAPTAAGSLVKYAFYVVDADCLFLMLDSVGDVLSGTSGVNTAPVQNTRLYSTTGQTVFQVSPLLVEFDAIAEISTDVTANATADTFTINRGGIYDLSASTERAFSTISSGSFNTWRTSILVNGTAVFTGYFSDDDATSFNSVDATGVIELNVGDQVSVQVIQANQNAVGRSLSTDPGTNFLTITRLPEEVI